MTWEVRSQVRKDIWPKVMLLRRLPEPATLCDSGDVNVSEARKDLDKTRAGADHGRAGVCVEGGARSTTNCLVSSNSRMQAGKSKTRSTWSIHGAVRRRMGLRAGLGLQEGEQKVTAVGQVGDDRTRTGTSAVAVQVDMNEQEVRSAGLQD